jgi:hypothetical protein
VRRWAATAAVLLWTFSCTNEEIVVAMVDGPPPVDVRTGPRPCAGDDGCHIDEFCAKPSCQDAGGLCAHRPVVCGAHPDPVCGCDGINYFNDCLRRRNGIPAAALGDCGAGAATCGGASHLACDRGRCVTLLRLGNQLTCPDDAPGSCWILPDDCGSVTSDERWMPCGPPAACVDTCTAMRSGVPHRLAPECP